MEDVFNIILYRKYLEDFYQYPYDEFKYLERVEYVKRYSDNYLQSIIDGTKKFVNFVLKKLEIDNKILDNIIFTSVELIEKNDIYTGLVGGCPADYIYKVNFCEELLVSKYLLSVCLENFNIYDSYDVFENWDCDHEIGYFTESFLLNISSNVDNYNKVKVRTL